MSDILAEAGLGDRSTLRRLSAEALLSKVSRIIIGRLSNNCLLRRDLRAEVQKTLNAQKLAGFFVAYSFQLNPLTSAGNLGGL